MWLIKTIDFLSFFVAAAIFIWGIADLNVRLLAGAAVMLVSIQLMIQLARMYLGYKSSMVDVFFEVLQWWRYP